MRTLTPPPSLYEATADLLDPVVSSVVIPQLRLKVYFTAIIIIIIHNCVDDCVEYRQDGRRKHTWN